MFKITWDNDTGGIKLSSHLTTDTLGISPRPVFYEELDFNARYHTLYRGRQPVLFIVNYEPVDPCDETMGTNYYQHINLPAIKNMYVNENKSIMQQYIIVYDPFCAPPAVWAEQFSCAVFIETYPQGKIPADAAKGIRKTWLDGYSAVAEFYHPNYAELPSVLDYRRTLYWNPMVTPDENGKAKIQFYNNSSCTNFNISAETVTSNGMIGVYKKE